MKLNLETKINAIVNVALKSNLVIVSCDLNCTFGDYINKTISVTKGGQRKEASERLFDMLNANFKLDKSFNDQGKMYDVFRHEGEDSQYQIVTIR
jgi:hypothetical protein